MRAGNCASALGASEATRNKATKEPSSRRTLASRSRRPAIEFYQCGFLYGENLIVSVADSLLERAKTRCAKHRGATSGFCRAGFLAELDDALAREHPELKRDDVFELIQSWLASAHDPPL